MPIAHQFPTTSSGLLEGVRQDDPIAWDRLSRIYTHLVWHRCRIKSRLSREDSYDVMQEVFLEVRRSIHKLDKQADGTFRGWLWTITTNKIIDFLRQKSRQPKAAGGSDAAHQMSQVQDLYSELLNKEKRSEKEEKNEKAILAKAVLEMIEPDFKPKTWQAFYRCKMANCPVSEVARELGMTETAVTSAVHRVVTRLKEELQDLDEFEDFGEPDDSEETGDPE